MGATSHPETKEPSPGWGNDLGDDREYTSWGLLLFIYIHRQSLQSTQKKEGRKELKPFQKQGKKQPAASQKLADRLGPYSLIWQRKKDRLLRFTRRATQPSRHHGGCFILGARMDSMEWMESGTIQPMFPTSHTAYSATTRLEAGGASQALQAAFHDGPLATISAGSLFFPACMQDY
jgi:hypothetical protein